MNESVVISGVGMVTPLGTGKDVFSQRLFRGDSGISPITSFDTSRFLSRLGAEVHGFIPKDFISVKNLRRMDRISSMTAASARMATEDAGFGIDASNRDRVGIILGVSYGSTDVAAQFAGILFTEGPGMASPILVPNTVINAPAGHTSIELGFQGHQLHGEPPGGFGRDSHCLCGCRDQKRSRRCPSGRRRGYPFRIFL